MGDFHNWIFNPSTTIVLGNFRAHPINTVRDSLSRTRAKSKGDVWRDERRRKSSVQGWLFPPLPLLLLFRQQILALPHFSPWEWRKINAAVTWRRGRGRSSGSEGWALKWKATSSLSSVSNAPNSRSGPSAPGPRRGMRTALGAAATTPGRPASSQSWEATTKQAPLGLTANVGLRADLHFFNMLSLIQGGVFAPKTVAVGECSSGLAALM